MADVPVTFSEVRRGVGVVRYPDLRSGLEQALGYIDLLQLGVVSVGVPAGSFLDSLPVLAAGYSGFTYIAMDAGGVPPGTWTVRLLHCDPYTHVPLYDPLLMPINTYFIGNANKWSEFGSNANRFGTAFGTEGTWGDVFHTFRLRFYNDLVGINSIVEGYLFGIAGRFLE